MTDKEMDISALRAVTRAMQEYEPEAAVQLQASPKYLMVVLLEASRRAVEAISEGSKEHTAMVEKASPLTWEGSTSPSARHTTRIVLRLQKRRTALCRLTWS